MKILLQGYLNTSNFGDAIYNKMFYEKCKQLKAENVDYFQLKNYGISDFCRNEINYHAKLNFLDCLKKDAYILISGGSLWDEKKRKEAFTRYMKFIFMGRLFQFLGKPVYVLGVGGGPVETKWLRKEIVKLLNEAKVVQFRDKSTKDIFESYGVTNNMEVTADTALAMDIKSIPKLEGDLIMHCKNKKKMLVHIPDGPQSVDCFIEKILPELLLFLSIHKEYKVILTDDNFHITDERRTLKVNQIIQKFMENNIDFFHYKYHSSDQMCALINEMDCIITCKLHVGVIGCLLNKSVIAFPTHREKTDNFYKMITQESRCINTRKLNKNDVLNQLEQFHDSPVKISKDVINEAKKNLDVLEKIING